MQSHPGKFRKVLEMKTPNDKSKGGAAVLSERREISMGPLSVISVQSLQKILPYISNTNFAHNRPDTLITDNQRQLFSVSLREIVRCETEARIDSLKEQST